MEMSDRLICVTSPPVNSDIYKVEPGMTPPPYTDVVEHPPCYSSLELTSPKLSSEPGQPQAITVPPSDRQPQNNQASSCISDFCQCCEMTCEMISVCLCCSCLCECLECFS